MANFPPSALTVVKFSKFKILNRATGKVIIKVAGQKRDII